ncbi:MAG: hypothetical protein HOH77_18895, partial [Candidatus Latescibacteria bacterium]|nr:hypothetical protein [Candidatus Latescibacterota bacterium]
EHLRVQAFRRLLPEARDDQALHLLGEWMYQSHASYSACGLPMIVLLEAVLC